MKELEDVLARIMSHGHGKNVMLDGYIIQMSGMSAESTRAMVTTAVKKDQSSVISLGLLAHLTDVVNTQIFINEEES